MIADLVKAAGEAVWYQKRLACSRYGLDVPAATKKARRVFLGVFSSYWTTTRTALHHRETRGRWPDVVAPLTVDGANITHVVERDQQPDTCYEGGRCSL
jgi:hypothetical protein